MSHKCLTTPEEPAEGVMRGLAAWFADIEAPPAAVTTIIHATTLITNSLIERKGAPTGLLTTEGCRDILEIGRENRYDLYDLAIELPQPLAPRAWRREVRERLRADGEVVTPLAAEQATQEAAALRQAGVASLAVCFLHAHVNDAHEQAVRRLLEARFPDLPLSLSSEVAREIGEYERATTTVVNAYVQPLAQRYLGDLERRLNAFGLPRAALHHAVERRRHGGSHCRASPGAHD